MKKKFLTLLITICLVIPCAFVMASCGEHSHDYGEVTYTWSNDNTVCTATRVCKSDSTHTETEQVSTVLSTTTAPTYTQEGSGTMTANFTNPEFTSQTKNVSLPKKDAITSFDGAEIDGNSIFLVVPWHTETLNFSELIGIPEDCTLTVLDTYGDPIENNDTTNLYPLENGSNNDFTVKITSNGGEEVVFDLMVHKIYTIEITYKQSGEYGAVLKSESFMSATLYTPVIDIFYTIPGYTFNGTIKDKNDNPFFETVLYEDTIIYVDLTPNKYTVTFDENAGDLAGTTAEVTFDQVPSFSVPVRPGCDFIGWELDGELITNEYGFGYYYAVWQKTENCTVSARWDYNTFYINYHLDGGKNDVDNPTSYIAYQDVVILKDATKADSLTVNGYKTTVLKAEEGQPIDYYTNNKISVERTAKKYSFDGWYTDSNFENKVTNLEFTYGTINLYAKWKDDSTENETVEVDYLVVDEDGNYNPNGEYLLMGSYFQTIKDESVTIDTTLNGSNGWNVGSDGALYKAVSAYNRTTSDKNNYYFSNNTKIVGGQTYYFKLEPLCWRLLNGHPDPDGSGWTILMSDKAISCEQYDTTLSGSKYETSYLREFFNTNFLGMHFNETTKNIMVSNPIDNSIKNTYEHGGRYEPEGTEKYWNNNNYLSQNTSDKIFALSVSQLTNNTYDFALKMKTADLSRTVKVTDFALAKGVSMQLDGQYKGNCTYYWTRSPYPTQSTNGDTSVFSVRYDGLLSFDNYGQTAFSTNSPNSTYVGVVPALRLDIRSFD